MVLASTGKEYNVSEKTIERSANEIVMATLMYLCKGYNLSLIVLKISKILSLTVIHTKLLKIK